MTTCGEPLGVIRKLHMKLACMNIPKKAEPGVHVYATKPKLTKEMWAKGDISISSQRVIIISIIELRGFFVN